MATALSACGPTLVLRNGVEMPVEKARQLDYADAEKLYKSAKSDDSIRRAEAGFERFLINHPTTALSDDAYFRLGQLRLRRKDYEAAREAFQKIVMQFPRSELVNPARAEMGLASAALGRHSEALESLSGVGLPFVSPNQRARVIDQLYVSSLQVPDDLRRVRLLDRLLMLSSEEWEEIKARRQKSKEALPLTREIVESEIRRGIESQTDEAVLFELLNEAQSDFIQIFTRLRLATLFQQRGDGANAQALLAPVQSMMESKPELFSKETRDRISRLSRRFSSSAKNIGILLPLSGPMSGFGNSILNGILLAFGYGEGRPLADVRLFIRDSASADFSVSDAIDELVFDHNIGLLIGPFRTEHTQLVGPILDGLGIPMISFSPKEGISGLGRMVFQHALTISQEVESVLKFTRSTFPTAPVAILYPESTYGRRFAEQFFELASQLSVEISGAESYPEGSTDFSVPLRKMVGLYYLSERASEICTKAERERRDPLLPPCYEESELPAAFPFSVLVIPDHSETVRHLLPHLSFIGLSGIQVMGLPHWEVERLLGRVGPDLDGAIVLERYNPNSNQFYVKDFTSLYSSTYKGVPDRLAADGFDTALVIRTLFEKGAPADPARFTTALKGVSKFPAIGGRLSITESGVWQKELTPTLVVDGELREF